MVPFGSAWLSTKPSLTNNGPFGQCTKSSLQLFLERYTKVCILSVPSWCTRPTLLDMNCESQDESNFISRVVHEDRREGLWQNVDISDWIFYLKISHWNRFVHWKSAPLDTFFCSLKGYVLIFLPNKSALNWISIVLSEQANNLKHILFKQFHAIWQSYWYLQTSIYQFMCRTVIRGPI